MNYGLPKSERPASYETQPAFLRDFRPSKLDCRCLVVQRPSPCPLPAARQGETLGGAFYNYLVGDATGLRREISELMQARPIPPGAMLVSHASIVRTLAPVSLAN